jgi:hypothetical protein
MAPQARREPARAAPLDGAAVPRRPVPFALTWLGLTLLVVALDYFTGPQIRFPVLLLVPLSLVAWRYGPRWGIAYATVLQIPRLAFSELWSGPWYSYNDLLNAAIRLVTFAFVAVLVATVARQQRELRKEVAMLHGILPICMYCKKIRNDGGEWEQLEVYISHHSEAQLSHGICAECAAKYYPELAAKDSPRSS